MRRKEKEITEMEIIEEILRRQLICTISLNDKGSPHIVPMNYGYQDNTLYFHSAPEGRKMDLLRRDGKVSFVIDDYHRILTDNVPCGWTTAYRSLMGKGDIEIVTNTEDKKKGLDIIMVHHGSHGEKVYREGQIEKMVILKLSIASVTCKQSGEEPDRTSAGIELLEVAKQLKALSETGLVYQDNPFDRERYSRIRELSLNIMANLTGESVESIGSFFSDIDDYPTPKVDVRGFVVNENGEILMVRERIDGKWTIPGGWADIGFTPSEMVVKEVREESGLIVSVDRLLAVYDKRCHLHPPSPWYIYKLVFLCRLAGGDMNPGFDILDAGWFDVNKLPELSTERIMEEQILQLYLNAKSGDVITVFD
jgi:nitroimidazol reductase NimA-like FMN-containing flavoprotein (pyridoxamine 5'-phosphate oxidase superfamily)/ADP-ribose pyrophosphatase YjhB (NUDIX family)